MSRVLVRTARSGLDHPGDLAETIQVVRMEEAAEGKAICDGLVPSK